MQERVLIVDDDQWIRTSLRRYLQRHGFEVEEADSCASAETLMRAFAPRVALLDYRLPDGEAIALLRRLRHIDPTCTILVLTGYGSIELAVRAVKEGATEFLTKPIDMPALLRAIQIGVRGSQGSMRAAVVEPLFGESAVMTALRGRMMALRDTSDPIVLVGGDGTGRRTFARYLHASSSRAGAPLVEVNCGEPDAERTVFGFEGEGEASRPGVLETASGGTLFLRDLEKASPSFRAKLLLLLGEKRFRRSGSADELEANVRVIAASDRAMEGDDVDRDLAVHFRPGTLLVPLLRERSDDILALARHLVSRLASRHGRSTVGFSPDAERALVAHTWTGNVRELENVLESALLLSPSSRLTAADLPIARSVAGRVAKARRLAEEGGGETAGSTPPETLEELERRSIERALREENWSVGAAARRLGVPRSTLYHKLKVLGLSSRRRPES